MLTLLGATLTEVIGMHAVFGAFMVAIGLKANVIEAFNPQLLMRYVNIVRRPVSRFTGSLAAKALMSRRSFTRHFRRQTGTSVGQWLLGQRLALAQRLLETTAQPIDHVAEHAGFGSTLSLRQHFAQAFNTTPSMYRREFRGG